MKRAISVILAAILVFSVLSVSAFATDSRKDFEWYEENGFKAKFSVCVAGETTEYTVWYKNSKAAILMNQFGTEFKMIYKNNTVYLYPAEFPFIHIAIDVEEENLVYDPSKIENKELTRTYTSGEYTVEEYIVIDEEYFNDAITAKFYYDSNNELKKIESIESENQYTTMEILETEISDKEFDLPIFSVNIMPIIEFLIETELFIF